MIAETPHSSKLEYSVLCYMLNSDEENMFIPSILGEGITEEHFFSPRNKKVFKLIVESYNRDRYVSENELASFLKRNNLSESHEVAANKYFNYEQDASYFTNHLEDLKEVYAKRLAFIAAEELQKANAEDLTAQGRLDILNNAAECLSKSLLGELGLLTGSDALKVFRDELREKCDNGMLPGLPTGIQQLDEHNGGMGKEDLTIIAAQTSGGKSVLCNQIACNVLTSHIGNEYKPIAGKKKRRVLIYTLEMSASELVGRMISYVGGVDMGMITQPRKATPHDHGKIKHAMRVLEQCDYSINDQAGQTIDQIWASAVQENMIRKVDLVVIDYLQLIEGGRAKGASRSEEVALYSRRLKQLAKKLQCPVISPTQLNDQGKVRESRAIQQDAVNLYYINDDGIYIAKARHGQRDVSFPLILNGAYQRFEYRNNHG